MKQPFPFVTDDTRLAMCLEMVGERRIRIWNCYSAAKLKELGCATIAEAKAQGKPGRIAYHFERSERIESLKIAYYDQRRRNENQELSATKAPLMQEDVLRIAMSALMMLNAYAPLWRNAPTKLFETGDAVNVPGESVTVTAEMVDDLKKAGVMKADGNYFKVGDTLATAGSISFPSMTCIDATVPKVIRDQL